MTVPHQVRTDLFGAVVAWGLLATSAALNTLLALAHLHVFGAVFSLAGTAGFSWMAVSAYKSWKSAP